MASMARRPLCADPEAPRRAGWGAGRTGRTLAPGKPWAVTAEPSRSAAGEAAAVLLHARVAPCSARDVLVFVLDLAVLLVTVVPVDRHRAAVHADRVHRGIVPAGGNPAIGRNKGKVAVRLW